jgi:hypothetical protein
LRYPFLAIAWAPPCFSLVRALSSVYVYVLFPGTQKCVPTRTFLLFSVYEFLRGLLYKNEPDMHVLCASTWLLCSHGGSCSNAHQSILPTSQHITSINIRSIFDGLMRCCRACQRRNGSCKKNRHILCFFTSMSSSSSSPSSSTPSRQAPPSPHPTGNRSICSDATYPAASVVRWSRWPY